VLGERGEEEGRDEVRGEVGSEERRDNKILTCVDNLFDLSAIVDDSTTHAVLKFVFLNTKRWFDFNKCLQEISSGNLHKYY
jgi:hypothetical protein